MCAILGFSTSSPQGSNINALNTGIYNLRHRGPDNTGLWISEDECLGMAHSRLSIIDLSSKANQPMANDTHDLIIGFNGEIYNFIELRNKLENQGCSFATNSDTEVILHGYRIWGKKLFKKLRGMFAISIYDLANKEITLARDHSGQKPLYFLHNKEDGTFLYASEIKGLFNFESFSKNISPSGLSNLLSFGFCRDHLSIYENIFKLSAGSYLSFDINNNSYSIEKFWSINDQVQERNFKKIPEDRLIKKLEDLLLESIEMQFRSDVPVGMLLSGGVDSSLIVALASKIKSNLNTYTVRFSDYKKFDESTHASLIANHFKTTHTELEASEVEPEILEDLINFYDDPIFDTSVIPTFMLSRLISKHCKVAIGGDGGDELFGGYPHYDKLLTIKYNSKFIPYILRKGVFKFSKSVFPIGTRGLKTLEFYSKNLNKQYPNTSEFFSIDEQIKIFSQRLINQNALSENKEEKTEIYKSIINTATIQDFNNYLREDILVKVDRASMANSLEIRSPFLDHKLIEFAFRNIPPELKVNKKNRKILLKKVAQRHLPKNFDFSRKQGFSLPLKDLMRSDKWIEYIRSKIQSSDPSLFNHDFAHELLSRQSSYYNNAERMAALLFLIIWFEKFGPLFQLKN